MSISSPAGLVSLTDRWYALGGHRRIDVHSFMKAEGKSLLRRLSRELGTPVWGLHHARRGQGSWTHPEVVSAYDRWAAARLADDRPQGDDEAFLAMLDALGREAPGVPPTWNSTQVVTPDYSGDLVAVAC